jgi:hypothetical protein
MKLTRRGYTVLWITVIMVVSMFTYATRDVCYVGLEHGNAIGYGSCNAMIDRVVTP